MQKCPETLQWGKKWAKSQTKAQKTGAPNENTVQNHLNIALLNVFQYFNGRYRHIFIP